jgi:hypothetical protein
MESPTLAPEWRGTAPPVPVRRNAAAAGYESRWPSKPLSLICFSREIKVGGEKEKLYKFMLQYGEKEW